MCVCVYFLHIFISVFVYFILILRLYYVSYSTFSDQNYFTCGSSSERLIGIVCFENGRRVDALCHITYAIRFTVDWDLCESLLKCNENQNDRTIVIVIACIRTTQVYNTKSEPKKKKEIYKEIHSFQENDGNKNDTNYNLPSFSVFITIDYYRCVILSIHLMKKKKKFLLIFIFFFFLLHFN